MASKQFLSWFIAANMALLAACAATSQTGLPGEQPPASTPIPAQSEAAQPQPGTIPVPQGEQTGMTPAGEGEQPGPKFEGPVLHRGTGVFIDMKPVIRGQPVKDTKDSITLNFEGIDIQDVAKTILGDVLHENYIIDPAVKGTVTTETSRPVSRADLMPILETLLQMNKATVVKEGALYRVVPLTTGMVRGSLPAYAGTGPGQRVQIVPLQYISAKEMEKILTPFVPEGAVVRADPARNLLILAGSGRELAHWLETVAIFDVDWLQGMSVGIFPIQNTEAKTISAELDKLFLSQLQGGVADMIRLVPIERLNAVLAVTPQPAYLDQVKAWVERLDVVGREPGMRLFVYQVKNRKAAELAVVLNSVFGGQQAAPRPTPLPVSLAPGLVPTEIKSSPAGQSQPSPLSPLAIAAAGSSNAGRVPEVGEQLALAAGSAIRIIADDANNALLIMATAQSYQLVEAALRKMDIMPRQVLVETSIIEVNLIDELRYGLQWFFKTQGWGIGQSGKGVLSSGTSDVLSVGPFPAFSYSIVDSAGAIRAVLNTLESDSKIDVLSNPTLVVLDNQTANIKVGDQVPIRTSEATSVSTSGVAPIITSTIEFRDTGVMLSVKPQVNPGGLVTLQIIQEVNDVKQTTSSGIDSPTITQRQINTVVAIQSGETVILGGLIKENKSKSNSGVPGFRKIPFLGALFGETKKKTDRTELVVLITPRVINSPEDARVLADEFRKKMKGLEPAKKPESETPSEATP